MIQNKVSCTHLHPVPQNQPRQPWEPPGHSFDASSLANATFLHEHPPVFLIISLALPQTIASKMAAIPIFSRKITTDIWDGEPVSMFIGSKANLNTDYENTNIHVYTYILIIVHIYIYMYVYAWSSEQYIWNLADIYICIYIYTRAYVAIPKQIKQTIHHQCSEDSFWSFGGIAIYCYILLYIDSYFPRCFSTSPPFSRSPTSKPRPWARPRPRRRNGQRGHRANWSCISSQRRWSRRMPGGGWWIMQSGAPLVINDPPLYYAFFSFGFTLRKHFWNYYFWLFLQLSWR